VLLGGLLIMAGWPAAYLRYRVESGVLGLAGAAAVFVAGMSLTVGWSTVQALVFPWMATTNISTRPSTPARCPSPLEIAGTKRFAGRDNDAAPGSRAPTAPKNLESSA
jgi:hypothetical protein